LSLKYLLALLIVIMSIVSVVRVVEHSTMLAVAQQAFSEVLPEVYIDPPAVIGLDVNDTFTVNVVVANLNGSKTIGDQNFPLGNLYGFDITLVWDPSILEYVSHTVMVPVETHPGGVLHEPVYSQMDKVDKDAGTYRCAYSSMGAAEPFNGNGTVFTMKFKILKKEVTVLHFTNLMIHDYKELKCVRLLDPNAVPIPNVVTAAIVGRDVAVNEIGILTPTVTQGYNASVNVEISNYAGLAEYVTIELYYNKTVITDRENLADVQWELIAKKNVTLEAASYNHAEERLEIANKTVTFTWNTIGMLDGNLESTFYIMANITALSDEISLDNNKLLSSGCIKVMSSLYRDVTISDFEAKIDNKFPPPAISCEFVNLTFAVLNNGTIPEEDINVTLAITGQDYLETKTYNISYLAPAEKCLLEYLLNTTGLAGDYTIDIQVSEVPFENDTTNNTYEEIITVVIPPTLNVTVTAPTSVIEEGRLTVEVGDTVTFNATSSQSNTPGETIQDWLWEWKVYKGDVKPQNLVYTYTEGPVMNFTINEYYDYYKIKLTITDSHGLTYMYPDRKLTRPYQTILTIYIRRAVSEEAGGIPSVYLIIGIIIAIVVIVAAVYYLKVKKER